MIEIGSELSSLLKLLMHCVFWMFVLWLFLR